MKVIFNNDDAPRMVDQIREGLRTSNQIDIAVSFVRCTGLQLIIDDLRRFLADGGTARVLTSTYMGITQPDALRTLLRLDGLAVRVQQSDTGFHPKMYLFNQRQAQCWIGSSNLSKGGIASNLEANLLTDNPQTVAEARLGFEKLWSRPDVFEIDTDWLDRYATAFRAQQPRPAIILPGFPGTTGPGLTPDADDPVPNQAQNEAMLRLAELRQQGSNRAVVIAAPGVGKTFLAAFDAAAVNPDRLLFVSHRLEHLTQAKNTFERVFGDEKTYGVVGAGFADVDADFVFCSIQSLGSRRSEIVARDDFDYFVVDEFHHAAAPSYRRVLANIKCGFLLGLTATPERQDGHDVLKLCDHNIAYEVRLAEAVDRRWLLPFHYFGIGDDTVEWSNINWRGRGFELNQLEVALAVEERVELILRHALDKGYDGKRRATVGFCAGVKHARYMSDAFMSRGLEAAALTGENSLEEREDTYRRFADPTDPLEWLFVADLLNEGVDIPAINSLLFLRPTDSGTIFIQQLGRGLRLVAGCDSLTVLDFVGHHRNAWLTLAAIEDRTASPNNRTVLGITPPSNCEIVLDDLTVDILSKVKRFTRRKKDVCSEAYDRLREEVGPPFPIDLWGRNDVPPMGDFRSAYRTWLQLRREKGDASEWEVALSEDSAAAQLLAACEKDWQQQRVYAYALVWGLVASPEQPEQGYDRFFNRFPKWQTEYKRLGSTKAWITVDKKMPGLVRAQALLGSVFSDGPQEELLKQVENRIHLTLERDFQLRHGGVLRNPEDLRIHARYSRNEIVNHFGVQYDPAKHNKGVLPFPGHFAIIAKLDTSGAVVNHQYKNTLLSKHLMRWQSQNQARQDNRAGRELLDHEQNGVSIHVFLQRTSHRDAVYLGPVVVVDVRGNGPMNVDFKLKNDVRDDVMEDLGVSLASSPSRT